MVSSVTSGSQLPPPPPPQSTSSSTQEALSSDQISSIDEILSNFDSDNLSTADAQSIAEQFSEAGIQPSEELASVLASSGFDAQEIGDAVRGEGGGPPPPPPQSEVTDSSEIVNFLDELLENYEEQLSDDDKDSILSAIEERFGTSGGSSLVDVTA